MVLNLVKLTVKVDYYNWVPLLTLGMMHESSTHFTPPRKHHGGMLSGMSPNQFII